MTGPDRSKDPVEDRDWGLTCAEFLELTTDYLESALPEADEIRFETHLAKCDGCSTILDQLRYQITATGQLREDQIPPESLDRLLTAFSDWQHAKDS